MKQYIIPSILSIFIFVLILKLPYKQFLKQSETNISITAYVSKDDNFQLFYLRDGMVSFSMQQSKYYAVKGSPNKQTISFKIEAGKPIKQLRLDLGQNTSQKNIRLEQICIENKSSLKSFDIKQYFLPNEYISYKNGIYNTLEIPSARYTYDPFLISNPDFSKELNSFASKQKKQVRLIVLLIAIAVGLIIFYLGLKFQTSEKAQSIIYITLFSLILCSAVILKSFNLSSNNTINENRKLTQKPTLENLENYPNQFENYINDRLPFRQQVIAFSNLYKFKLFNTSPKPELVQFGDNDFLFYNTLNDSKTPQYSEKDLEQVYLNIKAQRDSLSKLGIEYIIGFWPNKYSIYQEECPIALKTQQQSTRSLSESICNYFEKKMFPIFDVRQELIEVKNEKQIYYKLDSHWNKHGAYEAYKSFCQKTHSTLGLEAYSKDLFSISSKETHQGDLSNMLGLNQISFFHDSTIVYSLKQDTIAFKREITDGFPRQTEITTNEHSHNESIVLVFHDSFTNALKQFLSLHYKKVVYIWSYPTESRNINKKEVIKQVKPNIIIDASVERFFPDLLESNI